jgi:hypothetical protein
MKETAEKQTSQGGVEEWMVLFLSYGIDNAHAAARR